LRCFQKIFENVRRDRRLDRAGSSLKESRLVGEEFEICRNQTLSDWERLAVVNKVDH
jgi:hypothetical protein